MISKVYLWDNNMVMVFDEEGKQITDYQGALSQVKDKIVCNDDPTTQYYLSSWQGEKKLITKKEFEEVK